MLYSLRLVENKPKVLNLTRFRECTCHWCEYRSAQLSSDWYLWYSVERHRMVVDRWWCRTRLPQTFSFFVFFFFWWTVKLLQCRSTLLTFLFFLPSCGLLPTQCLFSVISLTSGDITQSWMRMRTCPKPSLNVYSLKLYHSFCELLWEAYAAHFVLSDTIWEVRNQW